MKIRPTEPIRTRDVARLVRALLEAGRRAIEEPPEELTQREAEILGFAFGAVAGVIMEWNHEIAVDLGDKITP